MKKTFSFFFSLLLSAVCAVTAMADTVQLATWGMEQSDDIAATWFATGGAPSIAPDECIADSKDGYVLTAWSEERYWQLCTGYQVKVLRIENAAAQVVTDYTDASQHKVYYEVQFPTTGYKNITVDFACAYGSNAEAPLEAVVSTDGGNTWFDAGSFKTASTWWTYNKNTITLSANNKEKVMLRLVAGEDGYASNWNLDYVTVNGEAMEEAKPVNEEGLTLSWPLGKGVNDVTAAEVSVAGLFSVAEFDYGKMTVSQIRTVSTSSQTLYKPLNNSAGVNDDDVLTFNIKPKKGLTFAPKTFSFQSSRWGTGAGNFDVIAVSGDTETELAKAVKPSSANEGKFDSYEYDLSNITVGENGLKLKIKVYSLASNKEYGFANVSVTGDMTGTPEAVPVYTMAVKLGTEGAGSVSSNPAGGEFDEGTALTVKATENFGYHFTAWTDADGNEISTDNPYSFEISENTELYARYSQKNVYALNLTLEGGANDNLVQFQPAGNVVDGIHYYEEGTDVKLSAQNNRILTFTNWEDQTTSMEREVKMDGEKNFTATFSATDFIVGWDLYQDNPKSERAADYMYDTENAGCLSLVNANGETSSWLANGVATGKMNGRYGIRVWRPWEANYYFQISFSSKGFKNLKLSAAVGDDYWAHETIYAQYSTDGENFTTFGTYTLPNRGWIDGEVELPEAANDQQRVYIRFYPDYDSPTVGVQGANDGTSVTDIFVFGEALGGADEVATLVSSNPENNSVGASANGSVILTFDNKVKLGEGAALLAGEEITPVIAGKTAVFKYSGLKYGTRYSFYMPEGVLVSRSGNKVAATEFAFTTMERIQPEKRVYDAVVAQDGSGDYTTVQDAIDAAPAGRAKPWLIFIKNGQYKEHVDIPATKPYMHLIGQTRDGVVIKDDRMAGGPNALHVSVAATVVVNANDCFFEDLTMENIYGHEQQNGPQALALNTIGDRIALNNVALLSYQDTWITTSTQTNRHYIKNSLIEGAVDFIYNGGDVYLDGDTLEINRPAGGYIVAPSHNASTKWGYVFQNTVIRPHAGVNVTDIWLGRPWHQTPKTVFINTQTYCNIPAKGWYNFMGGLPAIWAEYNTVDSKGQPLDLSQREDYYYTYRATIDGKESNKSASDYAKMSDDEKALYTLIEAKNVQNTLTAEEVAKYTIKNVVGGDDNWQPDLMCEACEAPEAIIDGNTISWNEVPYAICYVVTCDDQVVGFTTETTYSLNAEVSAKGGALSADAAQTSVYRVQAVNEFGGLSKSATATKATAVKSAATAVQQSAAKHVYTVDGRLTTSFDRGIRLMQFADGTVCKVAK